MLTCKNSPHNNSTSFSTIECQPNYQLYLSVKYNCHKNSCLDESSGQLGPAIKPIDKLGLEKQSRTPLDPDLTSRFGHKQKKGYAY